LSERLDDLYLARAREDVGLLQKLMEYFPGYKGYRNKEMLRETDRRVRETIYERLIEVLNILKQALRHLVFADLEAAKNMDRIITRVEGLAEKVRHAEYGYQPFMSHIRIGKKQLRAMLRYDANIALNLSALMESALNLRMEAKKKQDVVGAASEFESLIDVLERTLARRKEYMIISGGVK